MANPAKLSFTPHALVALSARQLEREWIERTLELWTKEPERFTLDPLHQMPGLNI
jgi:hypothetical protein